MKFVPLIGGEIQNEKAREQVTTRIKWQTHSKANEVTLELPLTDIQEVRSYLRDQSMEQVILGTMTDSDRQEPALIQTHNPQIHKESGRNQRPSNGIQSNGKGGTIAARTNERRNAHSIWKR